MRIPGMSNRTVLLGETGTGKSVMAMWLLAQQAWNKYPFTVIDYKGDELIDEVFAIRHPLIKTLKAGDKPPKRAGLYRLQPNVEEDDELVIKYLWDVYRAQDHGLYIDEGYAVPNEKNCKPLNAIFTQGRARNTPIICCYQRPVFMSRFAIAQASFISAFEQDDIRDQKTTNQFLRPAITPSGSTVTAFTKLPKYYSLWYDKGGRETDVLRPCPPPERVSQMFRDRLGISSNRRLGVMV